MQRFVVDMDGTDINHNDISMGISVIESNLNACPELINSKLLGDLPVIGEGLVNTPSIVTQWPSS